MKRRRLSMIPLLTFLLIMGFGLRADAASVIYVNNGYSLMVNAVPTDNVIVYEIMVHDPTAKPVPDVRVALQGTVNGAEYRVSGDSSQVEVRAMLTPQADPGSHSGEITFPEKGIWKMHLAVISLKSQQVLAEARFEESVGGVMNDETKGLIMLGSLVAVCTLFFMGYRWRQSPKKMEVTAHGR